MERFFLSALALLAIAGCRGQEEFTYGIHDGFRQGNHLTSEEVPATTFHVSIFDPGDVFTIDDEIYRGISMAVPDHAVGQLPFEYHSTEGDCGWATRSRKGNQPAFLEGSIRILEPRYRGLLVEFTFACEDRIVSGREVFQTEGRFREDLWPYILESPSRSAVQKLADAAAHAWHGLN